MKYIDWNEEKNKKLKEERGISFEDVIHAILEGHVLGQADHPNQKRYPGQKMYIIEIHEYAYVVPYVEDKDKLFFKTIFPSRRYTKELVEKGGTS